MTLEVLSNPKAVLNVYADPSVLDTARLHALAFSMGDPTAVMRISILGKATNPPSRWPKEANAAVLELQLIGLSDVLLSAWTPEHPPRIGISKNNDDLIVITADDESVHVVCRAVYVSAVKGYCRDEQDSH